MPSSSTRADVLNQVRHRNKAGSHLFVNVRVSPSEYPGRQVLLVTTSDITKRLEAERKLIQASKMATLGEMATGVAHELNQPMSVIKTASSFFIKKLERNEPVQDDILHPMLKKIDSNVDRATRIIEHMRQFARKSDLRLEKVQLGEILGKAFEIYEKVKFGRSICQHFISPQLETERKLIKLAIMSKFTAITTGIMSATVIGWWEPSSRWIPKCWRSSSWTTSL